MSCCHFWREKSENIRLDGGAYSEYALVGDAEAYIRCGMGPGTKQWSEGYLAQTVLGAERSGEPCRGSDDRHISRSSLRNSAIRISA